MAVPRWGADGAAPSKAPVVAVVVSTTETDVAAPLCRGVRNTATERRGYINCRHALTVFAINMAIVIGPTPPGTGVIALTFSATSSKSTSPTNR